MNIIDRKKLKKVMIDHNINTIDLSEILCVSYSGAGQKVGGFKNFNIKDVIKICKHLGIKASEILTDEIISDLQI